MKYHNVFYTDIYTVRKKYLHVCKMSTLCLFNKK